MTMANLLCDFLNPLPRNPLLLLHCERVIRVFELDVGTQPYPPSVNHGLEVQRFRIARK